ncbi:MAG TPA: competence/damage-inducible protein A [Polyangia bacterium]|nr:competence/damage-inducible protein A [Polyangia bacterium]
MGLGEPGSAGIILIGDEILSGKVVDENARFLIEELRELGVALRRVTVIPDVLDEIAATVRDFSERFEHVFTSGGVGPTHDDLTMEGVARAFGARVVRHPELEALLRGYYGAKLEDRNLRMAEVPEGAHFVHGDQPTWPVIAMKNVYILPGIPEIFRRKFKSIRERFRAAPYFLKSVFTSDEEGRIAGELDRVVAAWPRVQVGSYPKLDHPEYKVKVTLESKQQADVEAATADLVRALGGSVVRVD